MSMGQCSIAIRYNSQLFYHSENSFKDTTQTILPILDRLVKQAKLSLSEITYVVYTEGPGSFTGLRVACAVVQALCFAHHLSAYAISSLALLAQSVYRQYGHKQVLVMRNAHMQQIYWGFYVYSNTTNTMKAVIDDTVSYPNQVDIDLINPCAIVGDGWETFHQNKSHFCWNGTNYPESISDIKSIIDFVDNNDIQARNIEDILPVYLRDESQWKKV